MRFAQPLYVLAALLLIGCASPMSMPRADPGRSRAAITRIIERDGELGAVRNERTHRVSLDVAAREYADRLEAIDYTGAPAEFEAAFRRHAEAWRALADAYAAHAAWRSRRGEMHEVLDAALASDAPAAEALQARLDDVWSTWTEVEAAANAHGAGQ